MSSTNPLGAMPPPIGVIPDFSGARTELQNRVVVVYSVMTALSTFVLALRLYTRVFLRHMVGADDALVVLAWVGCIIWLGVCLHAFRYGFGEHMWNITVVQLSHYIRMLIGIMILYLWVPALTKLSLLALYHNLDRDIRVRRCIYALGVLIVGYSLATTIVATGPCNPLTRTDQTCLTQLNLFLSCINIITDLFILLLPMPMLFQLQLPRKQKVLLGMAFAFGSGVMIISTVRIIFVYTIISNPDVTYHQARACLFSVAEMNGGIICTCMVLLKPFFQHHFPHFLSFSSLNPSGTGKGRMNFLAKRSRGKSYELGSREQEPGVKNSADKHKTAHGIGITKTYDVNVHDVDREVGDADSTKDLFGPDSRQGKVYYPGS